MIEAVLSPRFLRGVPPPLGAGVRGWGDKLGFDTEVRHNLNYASLTKSQ